MPSEPRSGKASAAIDATSRNSAGLGIWVSEVSRLDPTASSSATEAITMTSANGVTSCTGYLRGRSCVRRPDFPALLTSQASPGRGFAGAGSRMCHAPRRPRPRLEPILGDRLPADLADAVAAVRDALPRAPYAVEDGQQMLLGRDGGEPVDRHRG